MKRKIILGILIFILAIFLVKLYIKEDEASNFAKDFTLQNLKGDVVKLSDYKGKVVVLNFFATWCPPCKAEFPNFMKVLSQGDKDVVFLFVNIGEDKETVKAFLEENNYKIVPLMDVDGKVANIYSVRGIPTTFIIGKDFKIKQQHIGYMEESTLKDLIKRAK
ncbi:Peroxiredoxin [Caloramator fervidus]|uniref:Peroxiredoxin n=1 Tax=Caloramator fervidus TaxID=29344 RepID=A0A1H5WXA3_9CLOT|nr:TlpA disulfide reductase family protein [Caloramator fervidus]SEG04068.1 Peroxiredoxin [Caloramator fervidus]